MATRNQIPLHNQWVDSSGKITQPAAFWLQQLAANLPPAGSGYVIDATESTWGQGTISIGAQSNLGSNPNNGQIYFAVDTGSIFLAKNGIWQIQDGVLTGDVTKPVGTTDVTLKNVNPNPGTYGSTVSIPVISTNTKGLITGITNAPIVLPPITVPGSNGNLLINSSGNIGALLDGTEGQILQISGGNPSWISATSTIEYFFNYGDASPWGIIQLETGQIALEVSIIITTAFDDPSATLTVGDISDYSNLMSDVDNIPSNTGTYSTAPGYKYTSPEMLYLSISPGASTTGSGLLIIKYST